MQILSKDQSIPKITTDTSVFFRKVYGWMTVGLVSSAAAAYGTASTPTLFTLLIGNQLFFFGLIIIELALVIWMTGFVKKASAQTVANLFIIYSLINGVTLSVILLAFTATSITTTFIITAGMFGTMALYGYLTKKDISSWGSLLFMGLIGIILASLVNMFLGSNALSMTISVIGIGVFVGLTAYDTQKLKNIATSMDAESEMGQKAAVYGALALYLDFINLFLMLLRFFGRNRD